MGRNLINEKQIPNTRYKKRNIPRKYPNNCIQLIGCKFLFLANNRKDVIGEPGGGVGAFKIFYYFFSFYNSTIFIASTFEGYQIVFLFFYNHPRSVPYDVVIDPRKNNIPRLIALAAFVNFVCPVTDPVTAVYSVLDAYV